MWSGKSRWNKRPSEIGDTGRKGGLRKIRDFEPQETCTSPEHNPPNMIVLSPGEYEYTCPKCGHTQRFFVQPKGTLTA